MSKVCTIVALIVALIVTTDGSEATAMHTRTLPVACHEDEACWNWVTMGNHRRGIMTIGGRRVVVSACAYRRMHTARTIDHRASGHFLGDALALRVRCSR